MVHLHPYGSRAWWGNIDHNQTWKGGEMKVDLESYYGLQKISSGIPLANTKESLYINDIQYRYQQTNADPLEFNKDGLLYNTDWMVISVLMGSDSKSFNKCKWREKWFDI